MGRRQYVVAKKILNRMWITSGVGTFANGMKQPESSFLVVVVLSDDWEGHVEEDSPWDMGLLIWWQ